MFRASRTEHASELDPSCWLLRLVSHLSSQFGEGERGPGGPKASQACIRSRTAGTVALGSWTHDPCDRNGGREKQLNKQMSNHTCVMLIRHDLSRARACCRDDARQMRRPAEDGARKKSSTARVQIFGASRAPAERSPDVPCGAGALQFCCFLVISTTRRKEQRSNDRGHGRTAASPHHSGGRAAAPDFFLPKTPSQVLSRSIARLSVSRPSLEPRPDPNTTQLGVSSPAHRSTTTTREAAIVLVPLSARISSSPSRSPITLTRLRIKGFLIARCV